jgi:hypothetical protein
MCQTAHLNSIDGPILFLRPISRLTKRTVDFCLWAPPKGPTTIGETEQEEVAWCTKPGYGTRVIPPGAITGVQFMRTSAYVQVVGFIDQTKINLASDDYGGELDPHGAVSFSFILFAQASLMSGFTGFRTLLLSFLLALGFDVIILPAW